MEKNSNSNNKIVLCKVTKVKDSFFEVITSYGKKGVVYINNISDYFVDDIKKIVQKNDVLYLVVEEEQKNRLILSFKKNRGEFLRTPFEFSIKKTKLNFKNLYEFTNKEIAKWKK